MCAAWKKKNERNEIVCFYCDQSDILLCGIARFSWGNKNELRTFQPQKWKKIKSSQPQTKFTCSYKKRVYFEEHLWMSAFKLYLKRHYNQHRCFPVNTIIQEDLFCSRSTNGWFWNTNLGVSFWWSCKHDGVKAFNSMRKRP